MREFKCLVASTISNNAKQVNANVGLQENYVLLNYMIVIKLKLFKINNKIDKSYLIIINYNCVLYFGRCA